MSARVLDQTLGRFGDAKDGAASLFTPEVNVSLGVMAVILGAAFALERLFLPAKATKTDRFTFVWLVFDALTHLVVEGSFVWHSTFGCTVFSSPKSVLANSWVEYARADRRWGVADPTIVSMEIITVLGCGPLCILIAYQIMRQDPQRHFWLMILNTMELYGGWMTFEPEWLTGSPNLKTDTFLHKWIYLAFFNFLWVIIPFALMCDSYEYMHNAFKAAAKRPKKE